MHIIAFWSNFFIHLQWSKIRNKKPLEYYKQTGLNSLTLHSELLSSTFEYGSYENKDLTIKIKIIFKKVLGNLGNCI